MQLETDNAIEDKALKGAALDVTDTCTLSFSTEGVVRLVGKRHATVRSRCVT